MSHLQKQRRMMSSMALGAPSWKSSCLKQGHSLSKMSQSILSMKKMRRMQMKCIHKFHFHMLLSCSELWEIATKERDRKHTCPRKGGYRMRTLTWLFLVVAIGQGRIFEKTVSCITDVTWLEQQKKTTGPVHMKRISCYGYFHWGNKHCVFPRQVLETACPPGCLLLPRTLPLVNRNLFWPFPLSSPLCWALEGGKAIFNTLLLLSTLCVNTSDMLLRVLINCVNCFWDFS